MNILDKVRHKDTTYLTNNIKDNQSAETLGEALKKDEEDIDNLQTTTQTSTVNKKVVIGLFLFFMTVAVTVFIFSSDDSSDEKKENKPKVEVADTQNDYNVAKTGSVDTIPDNYDSLAKHEQQPNKNINYLELYLRYQQLIQVIILIIIQKIIMKFTIQDLYQYYKASLLVIYLSNKHLIQPILLL